MKSFLLAILTLFFASTHAFVTPKSINTLQQHKHTSISSISSTSLNERQWNFNQGRGPWGLKKNAEIWNGRVAQMGFTIVLLQELVTGKGVIQGLQEGNIFNIAMLGITAVSVLALTAFLAAKGKDSDIITKE
jgi:hypothetical protein